jgi:hypothetical protein
VTWTLVNSQAPARFTGTSEVYTFPGGAASSGELDIVCVTMYNGTLTVPAGWTSASPQSTTQGGSVAYYFLWAVQGASAPSTIALANDMSSGEAILIWQRWQNTAGTISPDTSNGAVNNASASASPSLSVGPLAGSGELVIAYLGGFNGTGLSAADTTWGASFTEVQTGNDGGFSGVSDSSGYLSAGSGTVSPSVSWTSGTLDAQAIIAAAFQVTASGVTSSGAVTLGPFTGSGTAAETIPAAGAVTLGRARPAGTAAETQTVTSSGGAALGTFRALGSAPGAGGGSDWQGANVILATPGPQMGRTQTYII